jgi:chorismate mutase
MTSIRAIRGATQIDRDDPTVILSETRLLLAEVIRRNALAADDLISVLFTMTPELTSAFPAAAARDLGFIDVPVLCATEIGVPHAMKRVIRLLAHVQTDRPRAEIHHVHLHGAAALRPDLDQRTTEPSPSLA